MMVQDSCSCSRCQTGPGCRWHTLSGIPARAGLPPRCLCLCLWLGAAQWTPDKTAASHQRRGFGFKSLNIFTIVSPAELERFPTGGNHNNYNDPELLKWFSRDRGSALAWKLSETWKNLWFTDWLVHKMFVQTGCCLKTQHFQTHSSFHMVTF